MTETDTRKKYDLPDSFATVPAVALNTSKVSVPEVSKAVPPKADQMVEAEIKERNWLSHSTQLLGAEELQKDDAISWSAFHASSLESSTEVHPALTQLLPLFYEKAATAAMIKHGMTVLYSATEFLNPGQIPVMTFDAPLFALAKFIQWNWPNTHGEDKFIVMFGGLHIEMALWKTYGDYLQGSGWTSALTQAGVASSGTVDSFLKASHLTRTRRAHQITALALAKLQQDAFLRTEGPHTNEAKEIWRKAMVKKSPTFWK